MNVEAALFMSPMDGWDAVYGRMALLLLLWLLDINGVTQQIRYLCHTVLLFI